MYVHTYVLKLLDTKTKETAGFGLFPLSAMTVLQTAIIGVFLKIW